MEAVATPLFSQVRVQGERLYVDGLVVDDPAAVRLARETADLEAFVRDAIEVGARILDREHTGSDVEVVRQELEKTSAHVGSALEATTERVNRELVARLTELFGSGENPGAVPQRINNLVDRVMAAARDDLRKQFSADDGSNPLAIFQKGVFAQMKHSAELQAEQLRVVGEQLKALEVRYAELRAEKEKLVEVAAVEEKGTAKGRSYEDSVFLAVDEIARGRGDVCDAVGDVRGEGGRKGDVVVAIDACAGPPRGAIVFEAKDRRLSRNEALAELDACLETRAADYAVLVVPTEAELPARTHPNTEFNANKVFAVYDPDDGATLSLEVAYTLARARVLMARDEAEGLDAVALRAEIERATQALEDVRRIKSQLTNAATGIENARAIVETMANTVRAHLSQANGLLDAAA
jgi:hypothetical protein